MYVPQTASDMQREDSHKMVGALHFLYALTSQWVMHIISTVELLNQLPAILQRVRQVLPSIPVMAKVYANIADAEFDNAANWLAHFDLD